MTNPLNFVEKRTVLVVDDGPDNLTLLSSVLKDEYKVKVANSGARALQAMQSGPLPDLVLLDVMMPEMDGYTVQTKLQEDPHTKAIPIIILTAKGQMRDVFAMSSNVVAYMEKPFDPKSLRQKIQESLSKPK